MTALVPGDPASVSALAAELIGSGEALREHRVALARVEAQLAGWAGPASQGFRTALRTRATATDDAAEALAASGHALQGYTADLARARARARQAHEYCERHGLRLDHDGRVELPWGQYPVEEAARLHDRLPEGQRLARAALEEAQDAADRLARLVEAPVHALLTAARAAIAAVATVR